MEIRTVGRSRFFGFAAFVVPLMLYVYTAAPDVTWGDSGEFIADVRTLGIPHPTGYPLYVLLARVFCLFPFGSFAHRMNLFSGFLSALCCYFVYRTAREIHAGATKTREEGVASDTAALIGALSLGLSSLFWKQAVKTEVYALLGLLCMLNLFPAIRRRRTGSENYGQALLLVLGLSLVHHRMILFIFPWLIIEFFWGTRRGQKPADFLRLVPFFLLGLTPILYLWLRGKSGPALNWGGIDSVSRVWWTYSGGEYGVNVVWPPFERIPAICLGALREINSEFGFFWILAPLGLPLFFRRGFIESVFFLLSFLVALFFPFFYPVGDWREFFYLFPPLFSLLIAAGAYTVLSFGTGEGRKILWILSLSVVAGLAVHLFVVNLGSGQRRGDRSASEWAEEVYRATWDGLADPKPGKVVLIVAVAENPDSRDNEIHTLWYHKYVRRNGEGPVILAANFAGHTWYGDYLRKHGLNAPDWKEEIALGKAVQFPGRVIFRDKRESILALWNKVVKPSLKPGDRVFIVGDPVGYWPVKFRRAHTFKVDPDGKNKDIKGFLPPGVVSEYVPDGEK